MKKLVSAAAWLIILLTLAPSRSFSQVSVVATTGYVVNIMVLPTTVLPSTTNCPWGYNYNLRLSYAVTMVGSAPATLYTLQGTIRCGSTSHFFDLPNNGGVGTVNSTSNPWVGDNTCNTATVMSLDCNQARIDISGPGISSRTVTFPITYSVLPVRLTQFTANAVGDKVRLAWQTASEENSDYFSVERSANGEQWTELTKINAAGDADSLHNYQWYDENPLQGFSYYRLRITDKDAKVSYSEIRVIQAAFAKQQLSLFPVPNTGRRVTLSGLTEFNHHRLVVTGSNGVPVYSSALRSAVVELPALKAGIYVMTVQNELSGEAQHLRYVQL